MNSERVHEWVSILANLGVLVGIVFLVYELNYASRLAETEAYQARSSEITEALLEMAISDDLSEILFRGRSEGVESLSPPELIRARSWHSATIRRMQSQYYQYQQGFLDEEAIEATFREIVEVSYDQWVLYEVLNAIENQEWHDEILRRLDD